MIIFKNINNDINVITPRNPICFNIVTKPKSPPIPVLYNLKQISWVKCKYYYTKFQYHKY